ncbi:uncharacterized protein BJ171DRAFT_276934 [Polychytrium aggregatum]|uniref:uncharacterized protein n=1 Tax=Polychytrium aggregatum TaxID=110093 RepID=UPI0022FE0399|nr:uncharacterized protein BJ171DRAFT_276934 [Polychytrium aggregatum]KAI9207518.1 hypothetical protein BJ171DRAFT_276934 [Polychytrium aggregatum]
MPSDLLGAIDTILSCPTFDVSKSMPSGQSPAAALVVDWSQAREKHLLIAEAPAAWKRRVGEIDNAVDSYICVLRQAHQSFGSVHKAAKVILGSSQPSSGPVRPHIVAQALRGIVKELDTPIFLRTHTPVEATRIASNIYGGAHLGAFVIDIPTAVPLSEQLVALQVWSTLLQDPWSLPAVCLTLLDLLSTIQWTDQEIGAMCRLARIFTMLCRFQKWPESALELIYNHLTTTKGRVSLLLVDSVTKTWKSIISVIVKDPVAASTLKHMVLKGQFDRSICPWIHALSPAPLEALISSYVQRLCRGSVREWQTIGPPRYVIRALALAVAHLPWNVLHLHVAALYHRLQSLDEDEAIIFFAHLVAQFFATPKKVTPASLQRVSQKELGQFLWDQFGKLFHESREIEYGYRLALLDAISQMSGYSLDCSIVRWFGSLTTEQAMAASRRTVDMMTRHQTRMPSVQRMDKANNTTIRTASTL